MAKSNASSLAVNATCVGRAGSGTVACGSKGLVFELPSPAGAAIAFLTASVLATIRELGPAPTMTPLLCATARSEDVGAGRASLGHGDGSKRILASPESPLNPTSY